METMTTFQSFLSTVAGLAIDVKNLSIKFAVLFAIITAVYGVIKYFFGFEDSAKIDFKKYVWTPLIFIFLLANYSYIIDVTGSIASILINNTPGANTEKELFVTSMNTFEKRQDNERDLARIEMGVDMANASKNKNFVGFAWAALKGTFKEKTSEFLGPLRFIGGMFGTGWIKTCRIIIEQARNVILGFLVITGSLSLLFSITPVFRDVFKKWFRMYIAVLLWAVTLNILDVMVLRYSDDSTKNNMSIVYKDVNNEITKDLTVEGKFMVLGSEEISNFGTEAGFIHFIFGLMYLSVPLLTAFFIGDKMAGGMLSFIMMKTVDTATKAVGGAAGAATGVPMGGGSIGGGETSGTE
jgi:hypothetical protein